MRGSLTPFLVQYFPAWHRSPPPAALAPSPSFYQLHGHQTYIWMGDRRANDRELEVLGYTAEEYIGQSIMNFCPDSEVNEQKQKKINSFVFVDLR